LSYWVCGGPLRSKASPDHPGHRAVPAEAHRVVALAELYRQRWQAAPSLAHLKTTMQMDALPCQTVHSVLKQLTIPALV
jgi:hypothetical protein